MENSIISGNQFFFSSKPDSEETRIMHTKSNNIEIMIGNDTNEVIEELFKYLKFRRKNERFRVRF